MPSKPGPFLIIDRGFVGKKKFTFGFIKGNFGETEIGIEAEGQATLKTFRKIKV